MGLISQLRSGGLPGEAILNRFKLEAKQQAASENYNKPARIPQRVQLYPDPNFTLQTDEFNRVFLQVAESIDFIQSNLVTQHPVENGTNITDHIVSKNGTVKIKAKLSEATDVIQLGQNAVKRVEDVTGAPKTEIRRNSTTEIIESLLDFRVKRQPLVAIIYKDEAISRRAGLVITDLTYTKAQGGWWDISISLEEIRIVSTATTTVVKSVAGSSTNSSTPKKDKGTTDTCATKTDAGAKTTTAPADTVFNKAAQLLNSLDPGGVQIPLLPGG